MAYAFSILVETASWPIFAMEVVAICAVFGLMSFLLCLDSEQRAMARRKVWSFINREAVVHGA
jgi:hypothetical protein